MPKKPDNKPIHTHPELHAKKVVEKKLNTKLTWKDPAIGMLPYLYVFLMDAFFKNANLQSESLNTIFATSFLSILVLAALNLAFAKSEERTIQHNELAQDLQDDLFKILDINDADESTKTILKHQLEKAATLNRTENLTLSVSELVMGWSTSAIFLIQSWALISVATGEFLTESLPPETMFIPIFAFLLAKKAHTFISNKYRDKIAKVFFEAKPAMSSPIYGTTEPKSSKTQAVRNHNQLEDENSEEEYNESDYDDSHGLYISL